MSTTVKPNLFISFSGGRSSAVMAHLLTQTKNRFDYSDVLVLFANTGKEHPATLDFVNDCDKAWGLNIVWLESHVHHGKRKSSTHRITNYEDASRHGEPFEEVIKKYGIPNVKAPHCTRELKLNPLKSYLKSIGWKGHKTAIGIRADEIDRCNKDYEELNIVYPLIDNGFTKDMVNEYMSQFKFDLKIPNDGWGNCDMCYKKSFRKLYTNIRAQPESINWWAEMEEKYGEGKLGRSCFYRLNKRALEIAKETQNLPSTFVDYKDKPLDIFDSLDLGGDCDQGCEVY
jgi:3'-phosphoadenosine 5'-phosphosulfate sulfotransferase (PAPS reductase)/FAD synthetase